MTLIGRGPGRDRDRAMRVNRDRMVERVAVEPDATDTAMAGNLRRKKVRWLGTFVVQPVGPILYLLVGPRPAAR